MKAGRLGLFIGLILQFTSVSKSYAQEYCAAIRGNGELVPAHWSALSKLVENFGMPKATAGGSSASITMFFLESIESSKLLQNQPNKKLSQALMLKSLLPYLTMTFDESGALNLVRVAIGSEKTDSTLRKMYEAVRTSENREALLKVIGEFGPLINKRYKDGLISLNFNFHKNQLLEAISVFGQFDAQSDKNLFFREGLVDFSELGKYLGRAADFFAGNGSEETNSLLKDYINTCSEEAKGKLWVDINRVCQEKLKVAFLNYYKKGEFPNISINKRVSESLSSFPTTSVIIGDSAKKYHSMMKDYGGLFAKDPYEFNIDFEKDLHLGYWGKNEALHKISSNLASRYPEDLKSYKFVGLGQATWLEVLSKSPAEPGLANLQSFPADQELRYSRQAIDSDKNIQYLSAGGWSDLHPVLVLKSFGCENTVYLTRQSGESVFGQQVFIRLVGDTKKIDFWTEISENNNTGWEVTKVQAESPWNNLYNLANPRSSFKKSIEEADVIYCTNWNAHDVFKGKVLDLVKDAYNAPVSIQNNNSRFLQVNESMLGQLPGCQ